MSNGHAKKHSKLDTSDPPSETEGLKRFSPRLILKMNIESRARLTSALLAPSASSHLHNFDFIPKHQHHILQFISTSHQPPHDTFSREIQVRVMSSGGASKRKESPAHRAITGNGSRKRTKMTSAFSNATRHAKNEDSNDGAYTVPTRPAHALSNLRNSYQQERLGYQHSINELSAKLEESEEKVAQYRAKYKNGLSEIVEKKIVAAEQLVSDAEQKVKDLKQKHKENIVAIRKELVAAAKDGMGQVQQSTSSPDRALDIAGTALKKLKAMDPELYYELVKAQPVYIKLAAQLKAARETMGREPTEGRLAQSPDQATVECAIALQDLETDLVNAADDMRSNSTLSNQKKTLTKKMLAALKEVEPVFMAHAQSAQTKSVSPTPLTPIVDHPVITRKNQQLQGVVNDLQYKLKDVRSKLEEEVEMRQKAEAGGKDK